MENKNTAKIIFAVIGILAGIAAIGFGIAVLCVVPRYASFGGDFYSYIYKAARGAGLGIGFLLLFLGLADIAFFGVKLKLCEKPVVVTQSAPSQLIKAEEKRIADEKAAEEAKKNDSGSSSGGCYVATCVYGSYDCPQVWTLRRYRDNTLASTWYGRAFIYTYYAISPTLVKWFGHTDWFKKMWRGKLDRMVNKLRAKGVEDTQYEDKEW